VYTKGIKLMEIKQVTVSSLSQVEAGTLTIQEAE
jgi:hypothetical protein